uniref:DNA topoisomerase 6 subunit B n=1 Tax=Aegilops tauschii TaxID=37682 RepID=R7W3Y6_AEGTA
MRELVENALDSAESISELPDIEITIEEITKSKFNTMIGLVDRERVDEALYDDFESSKAREKRLAKEARFQETQAKNAALGKKVKDTPAARGKGRGEASFFRVTCKDNGRGMPHEDIPNMFGRVLSGTKYGLRQTRGKFGLGAKMFTLTNSGKSYYPEMSLTFIYMRNSRILHYMRQMAVITPYAQFLFRFLSDAAEYEFSSLATPLFSPQVFEGHPFIVEAGVSIGGKDVKQGLNIFRFANRIPLLFEQGADVITRTALKRINWSIYKINQQQDKIGVFVSIVSTKIPFKGTGKEYIGDDITEIADAVKSALKQCCIQLKSKIVKKLQAREQQDRKRNLNKYIPDVARTIMETLGELADESPPKRPRFDKEDEELLEKINSEEVTEMTFRDCLTQHVEQSGVSEEPREAIYLNSLEGSYKFVDFQSPAFVFRFIP